MRDRRSLTSATATSATTTPALWPDVLIAYVAPALSAGAGGLLTGRSDLTVAALTSIAGTSALVAALAGIRLRRRGVRAPRAAAPSKALRALGAGLVGAALGAAAAHLAVRGLDAWPAPFPSGSAWPGRLRLDLPLSAALAAAITTWRWYGARPASATKAPQTTQTPQIAQIAQTRKDTA
ncbi:hypothetical protein ACFWAR_27000 [Streptomyces sp. NPDC059917]|uniref:hypothetical protein n=1 Tax=Streptomyces sp. NPDC059917 TaxID=3347002 RepID=UPI003649CDBC